MADRPSPLARRLANRISEAVPGIDRDRAAETIQEEIKDCRPISAYAQSLKETLIRQREPLVVMVKTNLELNGTNPPTNLFVTARHSRDSILEASLAVLAVPFASIRGQVFRPPRPSVNRNTCLGACR
jgi:hypothetical protein